jgi:hypothetical protein
MSGFLDWLKNHKLDALLVSLLVVITGVVGAVNMTGYPERFEDEGTYVSQAWALKERGTLTHYTYWYDHPPAGWMQITGWLTAGNGLDRYGSAITAGREFMLVLHLATVVLLFALARRLGIGSVAAGIGTLAYVLSPLVVDFSRYVLLDNVALPWLLGTFVLALSPRRHLLSAVGAAVCMAIAILSKETFVALLPVLLYALWRNGDIRNRRYLLTAFGVIFGMLSGMYILYAALKNELLPGDGHVSLLGTLFWQLADRDGSGSIFDADSGTRGLVSYWLNIDYWLLAAGAVAAPIALFFRKLRVAAFALLIGLALLLRTGYLPFPYVVALLPFAALTFAGVLHYGLIVPLKKKGARRLLAGSALAALLIGTALFVAPAWQTELRTFTTLDQDASSRQAVAWIAKNIDHKNRLVVESALWTDLEDKGFNRPDPVWLYKTETDPEVTKIVAGGKNIDYVVLNGPTIGAKSFASSFPNVNQALAHSQLVAEFGQDNQKVLIYQVQPE